MFRFLNSCDKTQPRCILNLMSSFMESLSPDLFWDVSQAMVDPDKNARWLLERVIQRGRWEDWLLVKERYGKKEIQKLAPRLRLDAKAKSFITLFCED